MLFDSSMSNVEQQIRRAQKAVADGVVTRGELARMAGLRSTTIRHMLDPSWNPTAKTLTALEAALDKLGFTSRETALENA